ncbi:MULTISPECIES: dTDP-4-amino-4,6-dideoxygalactose transaminase [unclassified Herbaspirillum]|uniref:dTDP-4-amino-4,6-dideoxygalactose transaminase n=1 Tax=unclassified Herbaspirillum TaxID=2624150 RepID=UPI00114EF5D5|nr:MULTISPECIES: dTDP-4-amino-4,6-dideoxygalactose transaminase [unclassified Herbaspirillum]TQK09408.1 dTDP-4-amino-4,6-dideoxygalactose transaminase [Herbaspirillum sp. SJZ130]TQK13905.1 dTDP-4-amino-4,6-dideoxygalactose transaminase [Herbaspirillum sp. SJZ106]TWC69629.1 dTDP-4-amino-4,6-dideoxygalactose transaminase [Herbaspirillum sp. SJZ099]
MLEKSNLETIPFGRPFIVGKELYYIAQAVAQGSLAGDQRFTKLCHAWLEHNLGVQRALLTHSCTAALEMAAILTEVGPGDEVIMPSYTFVSTANAFVTRGATPVFVDIRQDTLNIDENLVAQAITDRTKAIVPVHYAGVPCEMDALALLAKEHGVWLIEDAAQAFQSTYKGKMLGSLGDLGCLSFHETKNVISGEGGALLINNLELAERAEIIREKGTNRSQFFRQMVDKYTWVDIGSSYLPGELISAFLYAQLEHADAITNERLNAVRRYHDMLLPLSDTEKIVLPKTKLHETGNGHMFYFLAKNLEDRTNLLQFLREHGCSAVFHYVPLHSSPGGKRFGKQQSAMHVTDDISDRLVRLPLYYGISEAEQRKVCDLLFSYYKQKE